MTSALGLTLEDALASIRAEGRPEPCVKRILPEAHPGGTERVVRVRPGEILVARFPDEVTQ
jgi:hypothetical protein